MRWSSLFIPTLREAPSDAQAVSQRLLLRAGYIRELGSSLTCYLPLAHRSLRKICRIVREEMDGIGAQEFLLPTKGTTTLKAIASIAHGELRSYKQLPQIWFQIQTFTVVDGCSFDESESGLEVSYRKCDHAARRILDRCGLQYAVAEHPSEFVVPSAAGEDVLIRCTSCDYSSSLAYAVTQPAPPAKPDRTGNLAPEQFHTPDLKTIADLVEFTGEPATSQMKSFVIVANEGGRETLVLVMVRGDHQVSETKLEAVLSTGAIRPALPDELVATFGAGAGSLGPVGLKGVRILADSALRDRRNLITGANRDDYHLRNVTPGEDFEPEYFDVRQALPEDSCVRCGKKLEFVNSIRIGRLLKVHTKVAESVGLKVLGADGKEFTPRMGSFSLHLERILACIAELHHDADGLALPPAIAPFTTVITPVSYADPRQREAADRLYNQCREAGIDTLLDDRDERAGVKFKDADLIGIPFRVTLGKKLASGQVEVMDRRTRKVTDVPLDEVAADLRDLSHNG
jgi:prolyl-tRNA synthetase